MNEVMIRRVIVGSIFLLPIVLNWIRKNPALSSGLRLI
jgi:hypothetical protein